MDRQRTNEGLGSTTAIPQHPGPVDGTRAQGNDDEPREARRNEEAELGQMAQRGAAAARARSAPDDGGASDEETTAPGSPQWQGQSVADAPDGVAERGAARAANFMPKRRADETEQPDDDRPQAAPMTPEEVRVTQELKRQSAVEDHAEARAHGKGTSPKGL